MLSGCRIYLPHYKGEKDITEINYHAQLTNAMKRKEDWTPQMITNKEQWLYASSDVNFYMM